MHKDPSARDDAPEPASRAGIPLAPADAGDDAGIAIDDPVAEYVSARAERLAGLTLTVQEWAREKRRRLRDARAAVRPLR